MNLYRIYRTDEVGYDEYDSAVVAAETAGFAAEVCPWPELHWRDGDWYFKSKDELYGDYSAWVYPHQVSTEFLGTAKEGTKRGVIVASFNAG